MLNDDLFAGEHVLRFFPLDFKRAIEAAEGWMEIGIRGRNDERSLPDELKAYLPESHFPF